MVSSRPFRALVLPALAIVVPSAFIAVLAAEWLSLEHETARLRGAEAAAVALQDLRSGLVSTIAEVSRAALPRLRDPLRAAVASEAATSPLASEAYLFDSAGHLSTGRSAASEAGWDTRAADLLATGARALAAGSLVEADRAGIELFACCASERDEFGVSYLTYAAWQRLAVDSQRPDAARPASVARDLRREIENGHLDRASDIVGMRLLAQKLGHVAGAASLPLLVEQRAAVSEKRLQTARTASNWLASLDWSVVGSDQVVQVGPWRSKSALTLVTSWRPSDDESVVLVLDPQALDQWVSRWSDRHASFVFAPGLSTAPAGLGEAVLTAPIFPHVPAWTVAVRRGPDDPATDRQRATLFMTAAGTVVALTLVAGYLVVRDAFRERRTIAMRSQFLAGVTHEIKTPLTTIRLMAETLQLRRASPGTAETLLATIVGEAQHLSDLVDNVLGTARVESGTRTYQPRVVCLSSIARSARQRCDYALTKEGFTVSESIPVAPVLVNADPDALTHAVLNLLGNAAKYSGSSRDIRVSVATEDHEAVVRVTDAGVGVPQHEHSPIFDSFFRGRDTMETTTGTGLGLALVKHFAEAHGGRVNLESVPGRGSTFSIVLPLAVSEATHG